jgi:molybdate transport system substrate-binding protein
MQALSGRANRAVSNARTSLRFFAVLLIVAAVSSRAIAADVIVLTIDAFKPVLRDLAPAFEESTRNTLAIASDTSGGVAARVVRGEEIDLIILPAPSIDALAGQGKVMPDSVTRVAKSGIGVVVKAGTPLPDISSVEAFKRTLLAVPSFAYIDPGSGGAGGIYLAKLFDRLGIGEEIRRKAVLVPGGLVASRVDNDEAALGLQQISELRAVHGVTFVGPLPAELQQYAVYAAGIPAAATSRAAARALLARLRGEAVARILTNHGLEPP